MTEKTVDIVIVGGGPAGLSAAVAAYDRGAHDILILERDTAVGGILQQCIHNGFGLHRFGEELTGPEYAYRYETEVTKRHIPVKLQTTVTDISDDLTVTAVSPDEGILKIRAQAVILAMGCRERPRGALNIAGTRPAGIYTAGTAQKFVNRMGYLPGRRVVILGSGDIGLIMARRMTLEGAKVCAVCELLPYSGGLQRNIEQCLHDFDIPLLLSHTVTEIRGRDRVTSVVIAEVGADKKPIPGTEQEIECDTLLLSCGLLPENELTRAAGIPCDRVTGGATVDQNRETERAGIYSCGNVLHVHDLVDYVSEEAAIAGEAAADRVLGKTADTPVSVALHADGKVRYTVPQRITEAADTTVYFRVANVYRDVAVTVSCGDRVLVSRKKIKVAPGEMETIVVKKEDILSANGETLTVGLEENSHG